MKKVKLLFIDPVANHNKFYDMTELGDGNFEVVYGRVGAKGNIVKFPMKDWDSKYKEKRRKGYQDITDDYKVTKVTDITNTTGIDKLKPSVRKQLELLHKYAKEIFESNYTVEITDITQGLIDKAQVLIDTINGELKINADLASLNQKLLRLFNVIPRKMKKVNENLFPKGITTQDELDDARDRMGKEQDLLDVIKGQIQKQDDTTTDTAVDNSKVLTYLDKLGLDIDEISASEEKMLKDMMNESKSKYIEAFKVTNFKTQKAFDNEVSKSKNKTTKLLFHGSRSGNWLNILKQGLVLHPNAITTGKLFDHGIYFADVADKSLGYISGGRWNSGSSDNDNWLAVYEVHTGNECSYSDLPESKDRYKSKTDLAKFVPANGFDSYFANRDIERRYSLARNEFIVYNEAKCTIKYIVHI